MPIKKRLTPEQRLRKALPKGYRATLRHPLLQKLTYSAFDPTPKNVAQAIKLTTGWQGASWTEKVFVLAMDKLLEKSGRDGILDPDTYNRLQDHLYNNEHKILSANQSVWHIWCWDLYHDHHGLDGMEPGDLQLPEPAVKKRKLKKRVIKKKPKRIRKRR